MNKTLHLIPGISGCGKTSIARYMEKTLSQEGTTSQMVVGHTTRPKRSSETDGIDYYFHDIDDFTNNYAPLIDSESNGWRCSKINQNYYFNNDSATIPNNEYPVRILPVSYSSIPEVVQDYEGLDGTDITIIPIVINGLLRARWLREMEKKRPDRDLERELYEQDKIINSDVSKFDSIYHPIWDVQTDQKLYTSLFKRIINKKP